MKKLLTVLAIGFAFYSYAQEPDWLDPAKRTSQWPERTYLTAFATEVMDRKQSEADAQSKLFEIIKGQLSDGISVSISAQTSLTISVENTATDESLQRVSNSSSEVELVGLKLDSYYNKRKKSLYAFGYVSIDELASYHRKLIQKSVEEIDENFRLAATLSTNEKIKKYVGNKQLFKNIQLSVRLLTALSQPHGADLSTLKQAAAKNEALLDEVFHAGTFTVDHLATRISGELLLQLPKGSKTLVKSGPIGYHNSGASSEVSTALLRQLETLVSASGTISLVSASSSVTNTGTLTGSFIQNQSEIIFSIKISDASGETIAVTEVSCASGNLDNKGQQLLPPNFSYVPALSRIQLGIPEAFTIKPSEYTIKPIRCSVTLDGNPIPNLSLSIRLEKDGKTTTYQAITDANGMVSFNLDESMVVPGNEYLYRFMIDLPGFLGLASDNPFLTYIRDNQKLPEASGSLTVRSPTIYLQSEELGLDGPLSIKVLEPAVKAGLSDLRYAFIESQEDADYALSIEAKARKGQAGEIATLTYVDATISLVNRLNGKEIYKNSFFNVKGIGANHEVAQSNAFDKVKRQVVDDITYELEYNR